MSYRSIIVRQQLVMHSHRPQKMKLTDKELHRYVPRSFKCEIDFRRQRVLNLLRNHAADRLLRILKKGNAESDYHILVYGRHVLATDSPFVDIRSSEGNNPADRLKETCGAGLLPLVRVLDGLTGATSNGAFSLKFAWQPENSMATPKPATSKRRGSKRLKYVLARERIKRFVQGEEFRARDYYAQYLAVAQHICHDLSITQSITSYDAIIGGICELLMHTRHIASPSFSFLSMAECTDSFGFSLGLCLTTKKEITPRKMNQLSEAISEIYTDAIKAIESDSSHELPDDVASQLEQLREVQVDSKIATYAPRDLVHHIACALNANAESSFFTRIDKNDRMSRIYKCIDDFLHACVQFSDEQNEGKELQFGLLMGNPYLMRYWPGKRPVPIGFSANNRMKWFKLEQIPEQLRALGGPSESCVIFPYDLQHSPGINRPTAAYQLDLEAVQSDVSTWNRYVLWDNRLAIYSQLTHKHRWSIGAVVGPGPEVRVFCGGEFVAHRDGKGWRQLRDPVQAIEDSLGSWPDEQTCLQQDPLRELFRVALQLSPRIRPESHGGLIVHHMDEDVLASMCEPLPLNELKRLDKSNWLSGATLFRRGNSQIDFGVANLIVRSSALDGAVCLAGKDCKIVGIAQRLTPKASKDGRFSPALSGTKRAAASAYVQQAGEGAIAIAASSDGPVRVFFHGVYRDDPYIKCFVEC